MFDEAVRPSRRPRLAMDTDPAAFAAVQDVTLKTPYAAGETWHATAFTVAEAARLARFDGVRRVWVVEYSSGAKADAWGLAGLEALGFHPTAQFDQHRSVVYLYSR